MDHEKLQEEWDKESPIDKRNLGAEAAKNVQLHSKWLKLLIAQRRAVREIDFKVAALRSKLKLYYGGKLSKEQIAEMKREPNRLMYPTADDIKTAIAGDPEMIPLLRRLGDQNDALEVCENALKEVYARGYAIGHMIKAVELYGEIAE